MIKYNPIAESNSYIMEEALCRMLSLHNNKRSLEA
jgi:hypothetical protein